MSDAHVVAIDCDLHRIHAWSARVGRVCYQRPDPTDLLAFGARHQVDTWLFEIAGALYQKREKPGVMRQTLRWMLFNIAVAAQLRENLPGRQFLVATSAQWTRGYSEAERRLLARADAPNHDLRECQCMLHFYTIHPGAWRPFDDYLKGI